MMQSQEKLLTSIAPAQMDGREPYKLSIKTK